jgi:hypothetical protein
MMSTDDKDKQAAKLVDAIASALELNIARNDLVAQVSAAFPSGGTVQQVSDFIEKMVAEKLTHFKPPAAA